MPPEIQRALEKLKNHPDIRDDEHQRAIVSEMERDLDDLRISKEFANSEVVKKQIAMFLGKIDSINVRLMTERAMTQEERAKLFNDKDMLSVYIRMNSLEEIEAKEESLKEEILREAEGL
jgi:hypothetical protein